MKTGNANDFSDSFIQSQPAGQRQVIRTKTLGSSGGDFQNSEYKKIADKIARLERQEFQEKNQELAEKAQDEILDKASEMRHLKYDVIEDADIVQISVINSGNGKIIRKVPPDKIVSFIRKAREKDSKGRQKFDIVL